FCLHRPSAIACEPRGRARTRPVGLAAGVGRPLLSVPGNRALPQAGQTVDEISLAELTAGGDRLPVDAVLEDHAVVVNREVGRQAETALTAVLELDFDVASAPPGVNLDPIADDIGRFLMSLQDQTRQLEPVTRGSHDEALHAGRDQALPQDPAPCAHRADYR